MFLLYFLGFAIVARAASIVQQAATCPRNVVGAGGSCCSPTNGLVVLSQQWGPVGPPDAWTMHGLWPNQCDGGFTDRWGCRDQPQYDEAGVEMMNVVSSNQTLYDEMMTYWPSNKGEWNNGWFWNHEWVTHGTCLSTVDPQCYSGPVGHQDVYDYFATALRLRRDYDLYGILQNEGIVPGNEYHVTAFENAIKKKYGVKPRLTCHGKNLIDFLLYFHVKNGDEYVLTDRVDPTPPDHGDPPCTGNINYF